MKVFFDREPEAELPGLFTPGMDWMRAAEAWARERGLPIERWQVDQHFQAGGTWHVIAWRADVGRFGSWEISEP